MKPDLIAYHKTIGQELEAVKNRVRYLIGDAHWGEEGRYKEAVLKDALMRHLPLGYSLGTGFVSCANGEMTRQIDLIVYDNDFPVLFRQDDFVILTADGVRGIIEVKTTLDASRLKDCVTKASENGSKILSSHNVRTYSFFNGVFCYNYEAADYLKALEAAHEGTQEYLLSPLDPNFQIPDRLGVSVNHIALGPDILLKLWWGGPKPFKLTCYELKNLAVSYFFSNLLSFLQPDQSRNAISAMFPLQTKEVFIKGQKNFIVGAEGQDLTRS